METKFKHKKTGWIATQLESNKHLYQYDTGIGINYNIHSSLLENSCDWEEIVVKDYEVLKVKHKYHGILSIIGEKFIQSENETIYSVKRLSDNEVFTIGDKITFKGLFGNNSEHKYDTIKGFKFKQNGSLGASYHNGLVGLEKVEKYKEPIFTTYDGVELFGGETIYGVTRNFNIACTSILTKEDAQTWKIFAKKTKAEEYIKQNEPKYSLKDVEDAMSGNFFKHYPGIVVKEVVLDILERNKR